MTKPIHKAVPAPGKTFVKITVTLDPDIAEMARAAAFWTPGETVASIIAAGIKLRVSAMEKKRGAAFGKRRGPVKAGRPVSK
jgi:hypothetical protein